MSGPTNEPIEVQRQEAYRNGLYEAKDMVWRRYKDGGKKDRVLADLHDSLMSACRRAEDVLIELRAARGVLGRAPAGQGVGMKIDPGTGEALPDFASGVLASDEPKGNRCGCNHWTTPKCPAKNCPWQGKRPVDARGVRVPDTNQGD